MESALLVVACTVVYRVPAQRRVITLALALFLTPSSFFSMFQELDAFFGMTELAAVAVNSMFAGTCLIKLAYSRTPPIFRLVLVLLSWIRTPLSVTICIGSKCNLLRNWLPINVATCIGSSYDLLRNWVFRRNGVVPGT